MMAINLLPWREKKWRRELHLFYVSLVSINIFVITGVITYNTHLNNKLTKLRDRQAQKKNYSITHHADRYREKLTQENHAILSALQIVSNNIPSACKLTEFIADHKKIKLKGEATSLSSIMLLVNRVKRVGTLKETLLSTKKNRRNNNRQQFLITMQYI